MQYVIFFGRKIQVLSDSILEVSWVLREEVQRY